MCGTGNPIDDCWTCDPNWEQNRQSLADCAIGFGQNAIGGRDGAIYVVTDTSDDATNPAYGTLRWGVIQPQPLWIIFANDMMITLKQELIMNSWKTLDGRGANVHIAGGACLTLQYISNVIVHGLHIYNCISTGDTMVSCNP
jgi:pectate lyase